METITYFPGQPRYPVAILSPKLHRQAMADAYLQGTPIDREEVIACELYQAPNKKKTPVAEIKAFIEEDLQATLDNKSVQYVICADGDYFKVLTGASKAEASLGYVLDSKFGAQKVVYVPNYKAIFYDPPKVRAKIEQGMSALVAHASGTYTPPGKDLLTFAEYPETYEQIRDWLERLLEMDRPLAIDIEAFGLKHFNAGIGTISFAWSKTEGIAFTVDYEPIVGAAQAPYGRQARNEPVRRLLRSFFERYLQKAVYHNIAYDVYVLIYQLFMDSITDTEGLLTGIDVMLKNWDDTKLIAYLATNSCAGNQLGLKYQAQEYAGNYAEAEIEDITKIPLPRLLHYNLVDSASTWYVHEKHYGTMVADDQLEIYETIFKPATVDIIQMQLTGMPVNRVRVAEVRVELEAKLKDAIDGIMSTKAVARYTHQLKLEWVVKRNEKLKKKRVSIEDAGEVVFNPNSAPQLQGLLFGMLKLPVLGLTDSKLPSTEGDILKALRHHTEDADVLQLLEGLIAFKAVDKILGTFIPALEGSVQGPDGWYYLFGNFNLGGTVSGRLSSSNPNLQNLPAKSAYGKAIKSCVQAPPGKLYVGLDFASLEDRISALTTRDPNKLKVYTDGFDGHCLRAYSYFGDQMPGIDASAVASINAIAKLFPTLRQDSKTPTFLLTYGGTYMGIMQQCGFTEEKAKQVESRYHTLYKASDDWVQAKLNQAAKDGYVTAAFGLRVRTPLLHQVVRKTSRTPYEAEAEGRTAGNALGQSWCLLNSRAGSEFMEKVRAHPDYRLRIRPCSQIHDASYYLIDDDIEILMFLNEHLVKAVNWNDHPDIYHPEVGLGGEVSIFYPTWKQEIMIPNNATESQIWDAVAEACTA